jgi:hypothetical protein
MAAEDVFDPDDIVADGLVNFVNLMRDRSFASVGGQMYALVADLFRAKLQPGDTCPIALPSMIISPDLRVECLVAITSRELIAAWSKGMFRKRVESQSMPRASITDVDWEVSTRASTRGATLLHVTGSETVTFALPQDRPDVADAIKALLVAT